MSEDDDLEEGLEYEGFGAYRYKPVAMFVADFESGECDMLWSYDVDQMDSLMAVDILKDAIGMLERKYEQAYKRLDPNPVIAAAMNIPPPKT